MSQVHVTERLARSSRDDPESRRLETVTRPVARHTNRWSLPVDERWLIVVGIAVAVSAGVLTHRSAAMPPGAIAIVVAAAGWTDAHTGRIPNPLTIAGTAIVVAPIGLVAWIDQRDATALLGDIGTGVLLGGAPAVFAIWLVAPRLIGGGDWKLLAVIGGALGYVAPLAASVAAIVGFGVAVLAASIRRRHLVVLGPSLAVGYAAALGATFVAPQLVGASV